MSTLLELAYISRHVYSDQETMSPILAHWRYLDHNNFNNELFKESPDFKIEFPKEFYARLYLNELTNQSVISYRGTACINNWLNANPKLAISMWSSQDNNAIRFYNAAMFWLYKNKKYSQLPVITGHSLGGYLATLIAIDNCAHTAVTFNAPGIGDLKALEHGIIIDSHNYYSNIHNFNVDTDGVHNIGRQIGIPYILHGHKGRSFTSSIYATLLFYSVTISSLGNPITTFLQTTTYRAAKNNIEYNLEEHSMETVLWALSHEPLDIQNQNFS